LPSKTKTGPGPTGEWKAAPLVKKNASVTVTVSRDDFTGAGSYQIISAPTTAKPGDAVTVVVRRS
jgi:hypothetical protein